jgi:hypothetical protein
MYPFGERVWHLRKNSLKEVIPSLWTILYSTRLYTLQYRGEILRPPENSVPQTIVLRYQEIGVHCVQNSEAMVLFLSKEYLDRNITFFSMLPTQFIPDFFVAEYYGLRNTIFWGSEYLASVYSATDAILIKVHPSLYLLNLWKCVTYPVV